MCEQADERLKNVATATGAAQSGMFCFILCVLFLLLIDSSVVKCVHAYNYLGDTV